jgi:hypothetical protein
MNTSRMTVRSTLSKHPTVRSQSTKRRILYPRWEDWSRENISLHMLKVSNSINCTIIVIFVVLTAVVMNVAIFRDTALCSPYMNRSFISQTVLCTLLCTALSPSCSDTAPYSRERHAIYIVGGGSKNLFLSSLSCVCTSHLGFLLPDSHQTFSFFHYKAPIRQWEGHTEKINKI